MYLFSVRITTFAAVGSVLTIYHWGRHIAGNWGAARIEQILAGACI